RGLAQRGYLLQGGRRRHGVWVRLVGLDLVGHGELLREPQDALRARVIQVMDGYQGRSFIVVGLVEAGLSAATPEYPICWLPSISRRQHSPLPLCDNRPVLQGPGIS